MHHAVNILSHSPHAPPRWRAGSQGRRFPGPSGSAWWGKGGQVSMRRVLSGSRLLGWPTSRPPLLSGLGPLLPDSSAPPLPSLPASPTMLATTQFHTGSVTSTISPVSGSLRLTFLVRLQMTVMPSQKMSASGHPAMLMVRTRARAGGKQGACRQARGGPAQGPAQPWLTTADGDAKEDPSKGEGVDKDEQPMVEQREAGQQDPGPVARLAVVLRVGAEKVSSWSQGR